MAQFATHHSSPLEDPYPSDGIGTNRQHRSRRGREFDIVSFRICLPTAIRRRGTWRGGATQCCVAITIRPSARNPPFARHVHWVFILDERRIPARRDRAACLARRRLSGTLRFTTPRRSIPARRPVQINSLSRFCRLEASFQGIIRVSNRLTSVMGLLLLTIRPSCAPRQWLAPSCQRCTRFGRRRNQLESDCPSE